MRQTLGDAIETENKPSVVHPDETWHLPREVYVACRPAGSDGLMLEVRDFQGQSVAPAYSSLDLFIEGCGPDQPWILLPSGRLDAIARDKSGHYRFSLLLDVPLPFEIRGTAGGFAAEEPDWTDAQSEDWTIVYLASQKFSGGDERVNLELQPMPGGHLAVMAYTSREAGEFGCGPLQSLFPVPAGLLDEARQQSGAHTICLDTPLPGHIRHGAAGRDDDR